MGLFHDLVHPPFDDICDTKFLGGIYVPWSRITTKGVMRHHKYVASGYMDGLFIYFKKNFTSIGTIIYLAPRFDLVLEIYFFVNFSSKFGFHLLCP